MSRNLHDWLAYIAKQYTYGAIDLGLDRVQKAAHKLNLTSFDCPVVTVAGTNGKGSCVAFLEAIALASNLRVGTYTSPHLIRFSERIKINGQEIDAQSLCEAFAVIDAIGDEFKLTYFELVTLVALYSFQHTKLDVLLLEVGLGGRLDAVNIIDPDIAVITSIAIDHTDYLGSDREAIGREKAGIMRESVPIVCGDPNPPVSVISQAKLLHAPFYGVQQQFSYEITNATWQWQYENKKLTDLPLPQLPLANAATALMVAKLLKWKTSAICVGLKAAFLSGRFQRVTEPVDMILDVAHNPESAALLAKRLKEEAIAGKTLAIVGMLKDKDIKGTLKPMVTEVDGWYLADLHTVTARGVTAEQLQEILQQLGQKSCYTHKNVITAYKHAMQNCGKQDRIIIFGSFYTVGAILEHRES